ncbi:hypothetical protein [Desulfomonile tiedjei]|uniref:Uncharacterized protein n=1 Tax=Desulfomonile tiedjei (strain ATCC 49306 / DSM 6799 / DCB-1) TaxID=706587 RepID=I4CAT2_DESTA|nr:hypothetical protein [Desulfomonile tiedjei]AFM26673.1 hypothetical protein Desti_4033 [Desulfomonile tiedjei DSM 6799]
MEMEDLTHRLASLIKTGKEFTFEPSFDFSPMLQWMEAAFSALAPLPEDQARFGKYSLHYKSHPQDRVLLGIEVLYNALINAIIESEKPVPPIMIWGNPDRIELQSRGASGWGGQSRLHH